MAAVIFKTKWFVRFARKERISDQRLAEAIGRAEQGIIDADLGGGLIKQRIAREGQGRSGGYRMLIAYKARRRAVFLYGFAKSERDNIDVDDLASLQDIADAWLKADRKRIDAAVQANELQEVAGGEEEA